MYITEANMYITSLGKTSCFLLLRILKQECSTCNQARAAARRQCYTPRHVTTSAVKRCEKDYKSVMTRFGVFQLPQRFFVLFTVPLHRVCSTGLGKNLSARPAFSFKVICVLSIFVISYALLSLSSSPSGVFRLQQRFSRTLYSNISVSKKLSVLTFINHGRCAAALMRHIYFRPLLFLTFIPHLTNLARSASARTSF